LRRARAEAVLLGLALAFVPALRADDPEEKGARRLEACHDVLVEVLGMPESIPRDLLDKAECVIVIPSVKKAALGLGARWGKGAASCRRREGREGWSAPLMMSVGGGSIGPQIGGQAADYVLLVMNPRGMASLLKSKFTLGADASVAAGPKGRTATAATDAQMRAEILAYSRTRGVFAGISIEGTVIKRDDDTNEEVYGEKVEPRRVLHEGRYAVPPAARGFIDALNEYSPGSRKSRVES
jgi:lipid-binding SYLF domain-containing protein